MDQKFAFNQRLSRSAVFLLMCGNLLLLCSGASTVSDIEDTNELPQSMTKQVFAKILGQESPKAPVTSSRSGALNEYEVDEYEIEEETTPATVGGLTSTLTPPAAVSETVLSTALRTSSWSKESVRRSKENHRRDDVRKKILESLQSRALPTISNQQWKSARDQFFQYRENTPEQRNCYLATCAVPKSTNEDIWKDAAQPGLRLNFNLPRLDRKHENDEVRTARLNLFIKPRKDCPCVDEDDKEMTDYLITIYQFMRPLSIRKRNKIVYKQKILNAVMVPAQGNAWITIDIKRAVTTWMKKVRKNFGVEVTVQDSYGATINAKEIFVLPVCSSMSTERACRDGAVQTLTVMPWTAAMTRDEVINENIPYVDVVITDKWLENDLQQRSFLARKS